MARENQAAALSLVLSHEGGWSNHPKDPGGATFRGVIQRTYDAYRTNKGLASRSVRLIEAEELFEIYDKQYWDAVKADRLPAGLDYAVFDYGVNSGPKRAVEDLQRTLNDNANFYGISGQLLVDGIVGESTVAATCKAAQVDEIGLIVAYCDRRMTFLQKLRTWSTFGKGWKRRVIGDMDGAQDGDGGVIDYACAMARKDIVYPLKTADLPKAIGEKKGEVQGKGNERELAVFKTLKGLGGVAATSGVTGQTLLSTAQSQVKPVISGESLFGRIALVAFVVLIVAGGVLLVLDWWTKNQEKKVS